MQPSETVLVPTHDITYAMDDVLAELNEVKTVAVDSAAVQRTIDRILELKAVARTLCCDLQTQNCGFEVTKPETEPVAVGQ